MDDWFEWEYAPGASWVDSRSAVDWDGEDESYATAEEAAASGFPPRFVSVDSVVYHEDGNHAVVELLTNEEPYLYPYTVFCVRDSEGRWHEGHGHN